MLNGLDNVQLLNVAAASEPGELRFIANAVNSGGGKVAVDVEKRFEFFYDSPDVITVEAARLDDVLNGRRFDLIIVDIEGSEYRAFKGMPETLSKAKQLIVELAPNHIDNVAHVSREEFLDAIPDSFSAAALLHGKESYTRSELLGLFEEMWEEDYYGSLNLLFVAE